MKQIYTTVGIYWVVVALAMAQETKPAVAPAEAAHYLDLVRQEAELTGQFKLAKEMTELHTQRAEEAGRANRTEKVPWETELAKEMRERANAVNTTLETVTKERAALEEKSKVSFTLMSAAVADSARSLTADETAFLSQVDRLLFNLDQELAATASTSRLFTFYLQTNNTPEDVARIAPQAEENGRAQSRLEREKNGVELQRMLFRALKK